MSDSKYLAILPQTIQSGDKIRIRGKTEAEAEQFSINFVNETCRAPTNISYHFKWLIQENILVEDYKRDGVWMDYKESDISNLDGRFATAELYTTKTTTTANGFNAIDINLIDTDTDTNRLSTATTMKSLSALLDGTFALEFAFQTDLDGTDGIYVYQINEDGYNLLTYYALDFNLTDIQSLHVWGDVDKINELSFIYN